MGVFFSVFINMEDKNWKLLSSYNQVELWHIMKQMFEFFPWMT